MRFGYSLTGSMNRPAVAAGSGYEVDKLSRDHSETYIKAYTDPIEELPGFTLRKEHAICTARQLGSRDAKLDRQNDRRIHNKKRL